ncbi:MAG: hypothetical protein EOO02_24915 [Chitinophagaceae bacterium]|nr:MAG: hypothetical protein EOO02_24915 [Chitinophagaceae bacterium]
MIEDQHGELQTETWELLCRGFWNQKAIPSVIPLCAQLVMYNDHPLLWEHQAETFLTLTNTCENIPALMGDLFSSHIEVCGAWIDFGRLYHFLPAFLGESENKQIGIPTALVNSFIKVLAKHKVSYKITENYVTQRKFQMLFCSYPHNWPDDQNFGQPHIIAEEFIARRLSENPSA